MKLVFDTNVLFSSFASAGVCHGLYERARSEAAIVLCEAILDELAEKLKVKIRANPREIAEVIAILREDCIVLPTPKNIPKVCRDPDDDVILALAVFAEADALVTGDRDPLVLKAHHGIPILPPGEMSKQI